MKRWAMWGITILLITSLFPVVASAEPESHPKNLEMSTSSVIQGSEGGGYQIYTHFLSDKINDATGRLDYFLDGSTKANGSREIAENKTDIFVTTIPTSDIVKKKKFLLYTHFLGTIDIPPVPGQSGQISLTNQNVRNGIEMMVKKEKLDVKIDYQSKGISIVAKAKRKGVWHLKLKAKKGSGNALYLGNANKKSVKFFIKYSEFPAKTSYLSLNFEDKTPDVKNYDYPKYDQVFIHMGSIKNRIVTKNGPPNNDEPKKNEPKHKTPKVEPKYPSPDNPKVVKQTIIGEGSFNKDGNFIMSASLKDVKKATGTWTVNLNGKKYDEYKDKVGTKLSFTVPKSKFKKNKHLLEIKFSGKADDKKVKGSLKLVIKKKKDRNHKNPNPHLPTIKKITIETKNEVSPEGEIKINASLKDVKKAIGTWKINWDAEQYDEFKNNVETSITFTIPKSKITKNRHVLEIDYSGKADDKEVIGSIKLLINSKKDGSSQPKSDDLNQNNPTSDNKIGDNTSEDQTPKDINPVSDDQNNNPITNQVSNNNALIGGPLPKTASPLPLGLLWGMLFLLSGTVSALLFGYRDKNPK